MGRLDGRVAVITGGASGIGEAAARLFVKEGAKLLIADILDDRGKRLAEALGTNTLYLNTDVSQEADVKGAVDQVMDKFGRLDIMFNNAGIPGPHGPIEETPVEGFDKVMAINLRGVFLGMRYSAPVMKRQGYGTIINTASIAGLMVGAGGHAYSAAKAAIIHLTHTVAMELAENGIRVNCICPGAIATPIFGKAVGLSHEDADKTVDMVKTGLAVMQPLKRCGLPEDIAKAALWLASDDSSFVNGHALVVDSGMSLGRRWPESLQMVSQLELLKSAVRQNK
jgi:NAD(P)-dependent dehydrogenase (short-subunit alcohol dehydrogenase family)